MPKVLFSPVGVVPEDDTDTIKRQRESAAAENAVKLNVYQAEEQPNVAPAASDEPKLREPKKAEAPPSGDVSDVVKKWSKK